MISSGMPVVTPHLACVGPCVCFHARNRTSEKPTCGKKDIQQTRTSQGPLSFWNGRGLFPTSYHTGYRKGRKLGAREKAACPELFSILLCFLRCLLFLFSEIFPPTPIAKGPVNG